MDNNNPNQVIQGEIQTVIQYIKYSILQLITEIKVKIAMRYHVIKKKSDTSVWLELMRLKLGLAFCPDGNLKGLSIQRQSEQ